MIIGIIVAYLAFSAWLTVRLRSRSMSEYMVAGRAMPAVVVGVLIMSEFIGSNSVATAQKAFSAGMAAGWSTLSASIGFLLFGLFMVGKIYRSGSYTISGAIEKKYGKSTMVTVSLLMIYALLLVNVLNIVAGAAALATIVKLSLASAMIIIAVIGTFYQVLGGMKGVAWLALIHTAVKLVGICIVAATALYLTKGVTPMVHALPRFYFTWDGKVGLPTILAWIIGTAGAIFSTQHIIQAISTTRSAAHARRAAFYAAFFALPLGFLFAIIGIAARYQFPHINSLYALPVFLQVMHPGLAAFVTMSIVSSVLISVTTVSLGITSLVIRDFYIPWATPSPEKELKVTRYVSFVIGMVPLIFCFLVPQILDLSFFTRALRLSVSIVGVIGFTLPMFASNRGATLGLIASTILTTLWYVQGNPYGIDNMYVAIVTPVLVMVLERILGWKPAQAFSNSPAQE
jgi:SSS family solute:Na+ symporter